MQKSFYLKNFFRNTFRKKKLVHTKSWLNELPNIKKYNSVGLVPYGTWDCVTVHRIFSGFYKNAITLEPKHRERIKLKHFEKEIIECFTLNDRGNADFEDFILDIEELYSYLKKIFKVELGKYDYIASYGLIDTLVRELNSKLVLRGFQYNKNNIKLILDKAQDSISNLIQSHDAIFIAESAYFECSLIRAYCFNRNIDLYALHPNGTFRKLNRSTMPSESYISNKKDLFLGNNIKIDNQNLEKLAVNYFDKRTEGKASDSDSQFAFKKITFSSDLKIKKVLFLHSLRDANNINSLDSNIFRTYIEWADYTLSKIIKNQNEWWIKIHPMSEFYKDDNYFVYKLLDKYKLNYSICNNCPQTLEIINNNMPVFTVSGTVALETLSKGFYSVCTGNRFSDHLVKKINSLEEYENFLLKPTKECVDLLKANGDQALLAKLILMDTKSRCDIEYLFPDTNLQVCHTLNEKLKIINSIGNKKYFF